jgi:hypothetical protein
MSTTRRSTRSITHRPAAHDAVPDRRFPSAVAGEDYERYARATWRQAERWFQRHVHRLADESLEMHEAREILSSVATTDLARRLRPQEERLLSELLQQEWMRIDRLVIWVTPEIPSFLIAERKSA